MKQPFWIVNSILLMILFFVLYIALLAQPELPLAASIKPGYTNRSGNGSTPINQKSIYENDIFKTYIPSNTPTEDVSDIGEVPTPPTGVQSEQPKNDHPVFLEPLPITVTGIMTFGDEEDSRIIIMDNRTSQETAYQIGDEVEDAQIVRILSHKVIIIRSNSQQEVLYLRKQEAETELATFSEPQWSDFIEQAAHNDFILDPKMFSLHIKSLSNFIDLLSITTAYKDGVSTGIKISSLATNSLVDAMGLEPGDIIKSINNKPVDTTANRIILYKEIISSTKNIKVSLVRQNESVTILYQLQRSESDLAASKTTAKIVLDEKAKEVKKHVKQGKEKFAKLADKVRNRDRELITKRKNKISRSFANRQDDK